MSAFRRVVATVSPSELAAIDAIRAAYLACNAAAGVPDHFESPLVYEISPSTVDAGLASDVTAMGHLAEAARIAWRQVGVPADVDLWAVMQDCGENAHYVYELYVNDRL